MIYPCLDYLTEEIMGNSLHQFKAIEDDCVYFYDPKIERYRKVCDVRSFCDLPLSVKRQIRAAKEEAAEIINIPIEQATSHT